MQAEPRLEAVVDDAAAAAALVLLLLVLEGHLFLRFGGACLSLVVVVGKGGGRETRQTGRGVP